MAWFIREVPYYRALNKAGRVVNPYSGETRLFRTFNEAEQYGRLSCFKHSQIEELK